VDQRNNPGAVSVDERMPKGAISADEAETLRAAGVLKGRWTVESEEEPSSDLKDAEACYQKWPEDWGGDEENDDVVAQTHGPVRIFPGSKYNHDVLPVGKNSPATLRRLKRHLEDDDGWAPVHIVEEDEEEDNEVFGPRRDIREVAPTPPKLMTNSLGKHEFLGLGGGQGVRLPPRVSPGLAQEWLGQVVQHNKFDPNHAVASGALPELDTKSECSPRRKEAECALDEAITENDEQAVERAIAALRQIDEDEESAQRKQQQP